MSEPDPHRTPTDPEPAGSGKEFASDVGDPPDREHATPGEPAGSGKQFAEPEQSRPRDDDEAPERGDRPRT